MLALRELLGSKLKFGLIALAIGLVVSLTFIMAAMSEGLITGMTGAKGNLDADALVFQGDTYLALERSRLSADDLETIAAAEGVTDSYGVGHAMVSVDSAEEPFDARAFGLGGRFEQLPIVEGVGNPGPGEAVLDVTAQSNGVSLGDTLHLTPIGEELTVVGFTENRRYIMTPAIYVDLPTWERIFVATAIGRMDESGQPDRPDAGRITEQIAGSASIAAVRLAQGTTVEDLAVTLSPDYDVVTPDEAAMAGNGMSVMILAVGGIQVVSLAIGALVIGVFFYITTLHKTGQIAAIKALGASNGFVYRQLLLQITVLVAAASVIGIALTLATGSSMPPTMAFDPQPARWATSLAAIFAMAYLGSLFSLRSILAIDPATALDQAEH
ncbi:MAG: ABC transporter permease [Anaerosomatales bacterium]|nr:ABC transporter permease [Anaerosomatales bacterium]MDT8434196.1 ABC transporter permease [Anaerosomatales bacterium]